MSTTNEWRHYCPQCDCRYNDALEKLEPEKPKRTVMQCKSCDTVLVFPANHDKPKRCQHCGSTFLREGTAGPKLLKAVDAYEEKVRKGRLDRDAATTETER